MWNYDGEIIDIKSNEESLERKVHNELAVEELNKCLDEIPENFRIAVVLRDFQELSYQEISKILEIPIGTIKSRINRGRIQLAEKLKHFKE
jgi:RNA polymerase sigma-70 factor (ECF subfamily)